MSIVNILETQKLYTYGEELWEKIEKEISIFSHLEKRDYLFMYLLFFIIMHFPYGRHLQSFFFSEVDVMSLA